jgi:predicted nucleotidyltransferase
MDKKDLINKAFKIAENKNIFYLVESGSRLWGFESEDSDYDLRGFFVYNKKEEFSIKKKDHFGYLEKLKQFDLVLFHIDKAFNLLAKSNPSIIEWLIATEKDTYIDKFNLKNWFKKEIKELINLKALFIHYYNLAKNNWQKYFLNQNKPTYKKILYVLRGLFSSQYILENNEIPPIKFLELAKSILDENLYGKIEEIVKIKKESKEDKIFKDKEVLNFINSLLKKLKDKEKLIFYKKENEQILFEKINQKAIEIKEKLIC